MSECVLALLAVLAGAQDTVLGRLRLRADSLAAEWRRAEALAVIADSLQRERAFAERDTIVAGGLRIVINRSPLAIREAATRAWRVLDSVFGEGARALAESEYLIRAFDPDTAARRAPLRAGMDVPWNLSVEQLTNVLLANVSLPLPPTDTALADWLGGPLRALVRPEQDRARVYIRLVTAPSRATRGCFLGDLTACGLALGLDPAAGGERSYPSAGERRALVLQAFAEQFARGATAPTFHRCAAGSDSACSALVGTLPPHAIPPPLGADARVLVLATALQHGGRGAYDRLLRHPDAAMGDRLAAAAGLPRDTVLARWRAEILAARPAPVALPGWSGAIIVGWILAFAACGLRSSRWRLD